ncbi:MAG TPA: hypothetical protein VER33_14305 [Polyangiaceae bacterium]|nr:hypothetical protein [Polyangiaceae bacterium]
MDPRELEALVQRLVQNPHDQDAITYAHQAGQSDPRSYAMLLEKVGTATSDPAFAAHWLTEAANVWSTSLGDAHRAARALMIAIDRDPTQAVAAERLADLYREKGDSKALVALLERRSKALAPLAQHDPAMRTNVAAIHEELGRLWSEPPLSQPKKAVDNYRRAIECDASSQYAIYALRELYKAQGQLAEAIPLFGMELALVEDVERRAALLQDEADARRSLGDLAGAAQNYRQAREAEGGVDPALKQQLAALTLERVQLAQPVANEERQEAAQLFVELSEEYPGEHGFSYALCALELSPGHDRGVQLAIYYGEQLGRLKEVAPRAAAYLRANPQGALQPEARGVVAQAMELGGDVSLLDALGPAPGAAVDEQVQSLIEVAQALARKAKKNEAAAKYREALALDPGNVDAVAFLEPYFRQTRKFPELRDMLLTAARSTEADVDQRRAWLKEVAALCESQLRDPASAIQALQESVALDPDDEPARGQLKRLLEKAGQWDALAELMTREAEQTIDVETRISLERAVAKLHEQKRKDPVATGEAWARIASLTPDDDGAILTAVTHFEQADRRDLAASAIADNIEFISNEATRASLLAKLGELRLTTGETLAAGESFAEAATLSKNAAQWASAEAAFVQAEAWDQAATSAEERAGLTSDDREKAAMCAQQAEYLLKAGDEAASLSKLEQATELDPANDTFAAALEARYEQLGRNEDVAGFLLKRADKLTTREARVPLRMRAAVIQRDTLADPDGARATLIALLEDGDEAEALLWLAEDAQDNAETEAAVRYLSRLVKASADPEKKIEYALREAALVADVEEDLSGALERYDRILRDLDPRNIEVLERIAGLNERLDRPNATAAALEKRLELVTETEAKLATAERLARLYEGELDDPQAAIRVLNVIRSLEPEDFDAVQRLCELCERVEDWPRVAELLALLIEVEGDEAEVSRMTRRIAQVLHEKVGDGDQALAVLMHVADGGDEPCRDEYVRLGDELGWKGVVASKQVDLLLRDPSRPNSSLALIYAFDRFLSMGREADAAGVAKELARSRGADVMLARRLEEIAVKLKDLDALGIAHDLISQELSGSTRAQELVRQAEVLRQVGVPPAEALQHGEQALTSVPPAEVDPLLERLSRLAESPAAIIDIYERQVTRCKVPSDRLQALARAAQVAAEHEDLERARQFLDIALGGSIQDETLAVLEDSARQSDLESGGNRLRRTLAEAMAAGGQGSRDGGRTRSTLLGRAAELAHQDLKDTAQAFVWLGDAIVAHVDDERLGALESLAAEIREPSRAEAVLSRALEEVFDGPLVRKLLARRASIRRDKLGDRIGAAADLKRLHDLSPSDLTVMEQLSALYTELNDHRGMVQLYEDQILRGKDPAGRAELARKVAKLWEGELDDPREAADAWRRVLRMKAGDTEALEGLERTKSNMLRRREAADSSVAASPTPFAPPQSQRSAAVSLPEDNNEPTGSPESATIDSTSPVGLVDSADSSDSQHPDGPRAAGVGSASQEEGLATAAPLASGDVASRSSDAQATSAEDAVEPPLDTESGQSEPAEAMLGESFGPSEDTAITGSVPPVIRGFTSSDAPGLDSWSVPLANVIAPAADAGLTAASDADRATLPGLQELAGAEEITARQTQPSGDLDLDIDINVSGATPTPPPSAAQLVTTDADGSDPELGERMAESGVSESGSTRRESAERATSPDLRVEPPAAPSIRPPLPPGARNRGATPPPPPMGSRTPPPPPPGMRSRTKPPPPPVKRGSAAGAGVKTGNGGSAAAALPPPNEVRVPSEEDELVVDEDELIDDGPR